MSSHISAASGGKQGFRHGARHWRGTSRKPIASMVLATVAGLIAASAASADGAPAASVASDYIAQNAVTQPSADTQPEVKLSQAHAAQPVGESVRVAEVQTVPAPASATASQEPPLALTEVVVTGSRIASRGSTSDSPLVTVGAAQIASVGQVSLDSAIGQLPQFAASQGQTEVGDVQGATGFQFGQSYADLRGLGPQRTLILLDGQRLVPTNPNGSVDLNLIPQALLESVDTITGGASAVYGSDAIAGVVNFRLRQDFHGVQLSYQHGASTHGDGAENTVSVLIGNNFDDNRGNAVVDLEYNERGAISGANRSFFSNPTIFTRGVPRVPESIFNAGELGGAVPISTLNSILSGYPGTTPISGTGNYGGYAGINTDGTLFTTRDPGNCVQNYRGPVGQTPGLHLTPDCTTAETYLGPTFLVQVPTRRYNLFSHITYNINDHVQAYGQINFMHSTATDTASPTYVGPGDFLYIPQNNPYVTGNAVLQTLLGARQSPSSAPLGSEQQVSAFGPRIESFQYNDYQFTAGLQGDLGVADLSWNVFGSYGQNALENDEFNTINLPAVETILYGTANYQGADGNNCVGYAWNPLGAHPIGKGCLEYVNGTAKNTNLITQKYIEGDLGGTLWKLPEGDLKFALGFDYRGDSFSYLADPRLNPAFNVLPSPLPPDLISPSYDLISSTGGAQNVREVYLELRAPLLTDKPFAKDVSVDVGGRHSQYDLFGSTNTWKADLHWRTNDAFTFRGGFERAIRAPSLQELYNPTVQAQDSISSDPCAYNSSFRTGPNAAQVTALCAAQGIPAAALQTFSFGISSANGIITGNPTLKPEVASTYSLGFVLTPHFQAPLATDLSVSVDYYHINISGAVAGVTLNAIIQNCFNANGSNAGYAESNFYCQQITRDPATGDIVLGRESSVNVGSYVTDGVDIEGHWGFALSDLGLSPRAGRVLLQSYISYLHNLTISGVPAVPSLNYAGSIGDTATAIAADGSSISDLSHPRWKANTILGYANGPAGVELHWRYISSATDLLDGPNSGDAGVPAYSYFDVNGHWQVTSQIDLTAGVHNLADKGPPRVAGAPLLTDAATYDVVGRTYFVGVKANLN